MLEQASVLWRYQSKIKNKLFYMYVENMDWSMISELKKSAVIIFRNSFVKDFCYPSFVMNGKRCRL